MYLIDTHALLWYLRDSEELSQTARKLIDNEEQIFTSIASLWEIAIKHSIGKLDLEFTISQIEQLCKQKDISILPIEAKHLDKLRNLPNHHNDPFDRLIICQALSENLGIITRDTIIPKYPVNTVW
ncbi:MAG: type II toxin-antitoxin system VapC family toxin [Spirochaetaceae bacterium]|nr:type II toxin-antitoxin system VapC family toxin [Spirochaetaceae bacterium]